MSTLNRVYLLGNLTRDPQLRKTQTGAAIADLSLAVSEKTKNKSGEVVENTCFVDIIAWDRQAEACGEHLAKGSQVLIEGRLQLDMWKTDAGEKRSKLRVRADRVQFLGQPNGRTHGQAPDASKNGDGRPNGNADDAGPSSSGRSAPPPERDREPAGRVAERRR